MINEINVKIKKLHPEAKIPVIGTYNSAGFDFFSVQEETLKPGETKIINTGVALEIPEGKTLLLFDRSGMATKSMHRFGGVIDSDYRGEIKFVLCNFSGKEYKINKGDRIGQGIIQDYYKPVFEETEKFSDSERGENWNNSTGR
ncbi:MAG: dUTP diphosphatase [Minisyncoccales bacterium]